jgi:hypothetical protein
MDRETTIKPTRYRGAYDKAIRYQIGDVGREQKAPCAVYAGPVLTKDMLAKVMGNSMIIAKQ